MDEKVTFDVVLAAGNSYDESVGTVFPNYPMIRAGLFHELQQLVQDGVKKSIRMKRFGFGFNISRGFLRAFCE